MRLRAVVRLPAPWPRRPELPASPTTPCMRIRRLVHPPGYDPRRVLAKQNGFCNFVCRRRGLPGHERRERFFEKLSRYKRVDSGGGALNNVGGPVADKLGFIANYKFTIAFENRSRPGYVTEKIFEPLQAGGVPDLLGPPDGDAGLQSGELRRRRDLPQSRCGRRLRRRARSRRRALPPRSSGRRRCPATRVDESIRPPAVLRWFDQMFSHPRTDPRPAPGVWRGLTAAKDSPGSAAPLGLGSPQIRRRLRGSRR